MKIKLWCEKCGHEQEQRESTKKARCSICHSRRLTRYVDLSYASGTATTPLENGLGRPEVKKEKVNDNIDNRRIGTFDDIYTLPSSNPKVKKENKEEIDKRRERWRKNELLHQRGRREQTGLMQEVVQFIGSMVSEKNPRGHGSKAIQHAFNIAEIKRMINDEGGDTRLLGENTRKLTGDNDSILGLGFLKFGKGGILERFRRNE